MSTEENKRLVYQLVEEVSRGNLAAGADLLTSGYRDHSDHPGVLPGPEGA
jgi:predicted SnoaL-like aldol condensation-catalyzing enzyme